MPFTTRYFVTDLDTENISEISLEHPPVITHWTVVCRGQRFPGVTRDAAEQAMLLFMGQMTPYRSIGMVGKHVGYQIYACDGQGRCYPQMGFSQGPLCYPDEP